MLMLFFLASILKETVAAEPAPVVTVIFDNRVHSAKLELGKLYINPFNEPFTITRFKYYISNLVLKKLDGTNETLPSNYFLVNEEDSASKKITIPVDTGSYTAISFTIGVDSLKNVSGTQTGALDPMNGMFWTWNSGYIMAKLEGTSRLSKAPNEAIEYHIGGFRNKESTVRTVTLPFPGTFKVGQPTTVQPEISIEAEVDGWFNGEHQLKIADQQVCSTPGLIAVSYADNYARMFRVASIGNK
jgi:hypothetical protein